jgi:hypothetical protein
MAKQWQSNAMFHTYYLQLKRVIESFSCMTSNTLHRFMPLAKLHVDIHFIYITVCANKCKEELQSYYKLMEEEMEEITKEWPGEFLILVDQVELFEPDLIGSPVVPREECDAPSSIKRKKKEEV